MPAQGGRACASGRPINWVQPAAALSPDPVAAAAHGRHRATLCYMRTVTHRQMRNNSGEILRAVAAGETVQVTNHGQVAAVISPPPSGSLNLLIAQGQARPARLSVADLSRIQRRTAKKTSSEILEDSRGRR